jgi:protein SCO1/2
MTAAIQRALVYIGVFALCLAARGAQSLTASNLTAISFDQKLGAQVDRALSFRDENGRDVRLGNYLDRKPVILLLGYYQCPMLCTLTLNGLVQTMEDMKWSIGKDFEIVNVSIDPRDTPALASAKKRNYLKQYGRAGAEDGWHFLTGDEPAIRQLADEVGFHYAYDEASKQYAHPSGLVILTPDGKISHYLFGVTYDAQNLFDSLHDASGSRVGSPIQQFILLCFHYNPITGKYGATIMLIVRILGALTIFGLFGGIVFMVRREKSGGAIKPSLVSETSPSTRL